MQMKWMKKMSKNQAFGLLFASFILFLDMLLYSIIIPLTPYYEQTFHASTTWIGILFSSYSVALLICTPYFGKLADRVGRKKPILIGLAGMTIATILFSQPIRFEILILARALQGMAAAATWTASLALLADLFQKEERAIAMGFAMTCISAGTLLGAPAGGLLVELGGYATPFYSTSAVLIVVMVLAAIYLKEKLGKGVQVPMKIQELLKKRAVIWILCIMVVSEGTLTMLEPLLPIYLSDSYSDSSLFVGVMFGVLTLAFGIMAPISGHLINIYKPTRVVLTGLVLIGILLPFIVWAKTSWHMAIVLFLIGASMSLAVSPTLTMLGNSLDESEQHAYGALYGLFNIFFAVAAIFGPFLGGVMTDIFSIRTAILITSGIILLCTMGLAFSRKSSMYESG
jgi:multidrug resistance protein